MKKLLALAVLLISLASTKGYSQYSRKIDNFKGEIICRYDANSISFNKYITETDTMYQTAFYIYDTYFTTSASDAILLFSDKTKLELSGNVDINYVSPGYYRYTYYTYDKEVVEKIATSQLIGFKLHIFEKYLSQSNKPIVKNGANKILIAK
jgi:hypothetical protein